MLSETEKSIPHRVSRTILEKVNPQVLLQQADKLGGFVQHYGAERLTNMLLIMVRTTLVGVVYALEAKDEYSCRHSQRVAIMTERFCKVMNLPESECTLYRMIAEVHDIGKIGIPDCVLNKAARLTDEEFARMRSHTDTGRDIIQKMVDPSDGMDVTDAFPPIVHTQMMRAMHEIQEGVHHHHERWDGHGYPTGLAGENISLCARMIALCDSTDAMRSDRVYRKALSQDVCKEEISRNAGLMYDPQLVRVFLANWDTIVGDLYAPSNKENET